MELHTLEASLGCRWRSLRTLPGKLLLGSTGARLYADFLDPVPGFMGRLDFIHKLNLPGLFSLTLNGRQPSALNAWWRPWELVSRYRADNVTLREIKFITWQDCAVCRVDWRNTGSTPAVLHLVIAPGWEIFPQKNGFEFARACRTHGFCLQAAAVCEPTFSSGEWTLPPNSRGSVTIKVAVALRGETSPHHLAARAQSAGLDAHRQREAAWYAGAPSFVCAQDPPLQAAWNYRWFLLRHNYARPNCGNMRHGLFYEGRSHKAAKDEDAPRGHEFSQLIPLSTPMHLLDARWLAGHTEWKQTVLSLLDSADENGQFRTMRVDGFGCVYGNFAAWGVYQAALADPDPAFVRRILPGLKSFVRGIGRTACLPGDVLPVCRNHRLTGKEYQPSFWYFQDFPARVDGKSATEPLKRVDLAVYYYRNAQGLARLCAMVGDADADEFEALAARIAENVLARMWDEDSGFFYDLRASDDAKALAKCVTGIYPLWAGMPGVDAARLLETFLRPGLFSLGSGFASAAADCPAFSAQGGWNALFFKGRNGCVWNGPSWPYTTGIALDALGRAARAGLCGGAVFLCFLRQYAAQHFRFGDVHTPYLVEHYDCITGEALSDEADYLHSYYIDLLVRYIAGIEPAEGGVRVAPLNTPLRDFAFSALYAAGHRIDVTCNAGEYRACIDGAPRVQFLLSEGERPHELYIRF